MAKILRSIRYNGQAYHPGRKGHVELLRQLPPDVLRRVEKSGAIEGFVDVDPDQVVPEDDEVGLSNVLIRDLRYRLGAIDDPDEIRRLRSLETRVTAIQHYDTRLTELGVT